MDDAHSIEHAVGAMLSRSWDPIGTAPSLQAGRDAYVADVCRLLASGAPDQEVAAYLCDAETERLGFVDSEWQMLVPLAGKLRRLYARTVQPPAA